MSGFQPARPYLVKWVSHWNTLHTTQPHTLVKQPHTVSCGLLGAHGGRTPGGGGVGGGGGGHDSYVMLIPSALRPTKSKQDHHHHHHHHHHHQNNRQADKSGRELAGAKLRVYFAAFDVNRRREQGHKQPVQIKQHVYFAAFFSGGIVHKPRRFAQTIDHDNSLFAH